MECVNLAKAVGTAFGYTASKALSLIHAINQSSLAAYSQVHSCIVNVALNSTQSSTSSLDISLLVC